jgi:hypothetical protein
VIWYPEAGGGFWEKMTEETMIKSIYEQMGGTYPPGEDSMYHPDAVPVHAKAGCDPPYGDWWLRPS